MIRVKKPKHQDVFHFSKTNLSCRTGGTAATGALKKMRQKEPREGVIIECPLNGQFHDRRDVILTLRMAVNNNFSFFRAFV